MYNIAIIGSGQLGSRHLQGLKQANLEMNIFVVDTSPDALIFAKHRYDEVDNRHSNKSLHLLTDIGALPPQLDLAIIATGSISRAVVVTKLLDTLSVRNIVLEKFLFPAVNEYYEIQETFKEKSVNAWVNCPRRMFSYYKDLKNELSNAKQIKFDVIGRSWGLACNSIHFIDVLSFLLSEQSYNISTSCLDREILESKRKGYIELSGSINGEFSPEKTFSLISLRGDYEPPQISITTEQFEFDIYESLGEMSKRSLTTMDTKKDKINMPFQSELTTILAEQILIKGTCDLPTYEESSSLHLKFLIPILNFYNSITGKTNERCPIT